MKILLETDGLVFAEKPVGVLSEESGDDNMVTMLREATGKTIYPIHRLDRAVGGVMVFAASKQNAGGTLIAKKEYLAAVHGKTDAEGEFVDLLFKDSRSNKSYVVKRLRRGVREARLTYKTLAEADGMSLVAVTLGSGRSHQIRVQFSSRRHPIVGDGKYGASDGCDIALFSRYLAVECDGKYAEASALPDTSKYPWSTFKDVIEEVYG